MSLLVPAVRTGFAKDVNTNERHKQHLWGEENSTTFCTLMAFPYQKFPQKFALFVPELSKLVGFNNTRVPLNRQLLSVPSIVTLPVERKSITFRFLLLSVFFFFYFFVCCCCYMLTAQLL